MKITLERLIIIVITLLALYFWWNGNSLTNEIEKIQNRYDTKSKLLDKALKDYVNYRKEATFKSDSLENELRTRGKDYDALEREYKANKKHNKHIKKDELQGVIDNLPLESFTD